MQMKSPASYRRPWGDNPGISRGNVRATADRGASLGQLPIQVSFNDNGFVSR